MAASMKLRDGAAVESSAAVRDRVISARNIQLARFQNEKKIYSNAQMPPKLLRKHCEISAEGEKLLETAIQKPSPISTPPRLSCRAI